MGTPDPVVPACRYGHGNLTLIADEITDTYALPGAFTQLRDYGFLVRLYVCLRCGYSELFDTDPEKTASDLLDVAK